MKKLFSISPMLMAMQLMFALLVGGFMASATGSPMIGYGTTALVAAVPVMNYALPKNALFTSLDLTKLTQTLGDYCRENRNILVTETLLDTDFEQRYNMLDDVTDEVALPSLQIGDIVKPADATAFTPTDNAIGFGARILKARGMKVDIELIPQIMEKTWLGKQKKPNDPFDMPFEAYIMEQLVKKAKENIRLRALYKGVYNATGTTTADTMTGFDTLVAAEIAAGRIAATTTGAITKDNIIDKLQLVYDSLSEPYKGAATVCDLPTQLFDWYVRKFQPVVNQTLVVTDGAAAMRSPWLTEVPLTGTNAILRREPGKANNAPFFFTPQENMYMGVDSSVFNIDIQKFNRTIKILMDFKVGIQLAETFAGSIAVNAAV